MDILDVEYKGCGIWSCQAGGIEEDSGNIPGCSEGGCCDRGGC